MFIGRADVEAETPILWPPDEKNWLIWKDPNAWKGWRQEEKGTTGWDVWMASPIQWTWIWVNSGSWWWTGSPGTYSPWGHKESDMTEQLYWTEHNMQSCLLMPLTIICLVLYFPHLTQLYFQKSRDFSKESYANLCSMVYVLCPIWLSNYQNRYREYCFHNWFLFCQDQCNMTFTLSSPSLDSTSVIKIHSWAKLCVFR